MVSFAFTVKSEIYRNKAVRARHRLAQGYGLLLFGRKFSREEMGLTTERRAIARLYADFIYHAIGINGSVTIQESSRGEQIISYAVSVDDPADREQIIEFLGNNTDAIDFSLLTKEGDLSAFLGGMYLACGSITDPKKNYLLELTAYNPALVEPLSQLLEEVIGTPPKRTEKREMPILYYRDSGLIEDMLTVMGASMASLSLMEVKIYKDMRNKVNRVTNCETANIDKTVTAASNQMEDIRLIYREMGADSLPEELREIAALRLENPDMSLRELGEELSSPLSRSGVNHRLKRLSEMAQILREKQ